MTADDRLYRRQKIADASLDTCELFFRLQPPAVFREIARLGRIEPCRTPQGLVIGFRVIRNRPDIVWLQQADQLAHRFGGKVHRFDIALDVAPRPGLRELLTTTAVVKWSLKGCMHDTEPDGTGTTYWGRGRRRLALYGDKPNRITGELDCVHFELRLIGARIIGRQGIHRPADLIGLNPRKLFDRHVMWSDAGARLVQKAMRRASNEYRERYKGQRLDAFMDDFVAGRPKAARTILREIGLNRSQNLSRQRVHRHRIEPVLTIPNELHWSVVAGPQVVVPVIKHPLDTHILQKPKHFNGSPKANTASPQPHHHIDELSHPAQLTATDLNGSTRKHDPIQAEPHPIEPRPRTRSRIPLDDPLPRPRDIIEPRPFSRPWLHPRPIIEPRPLSRPSRIRIPHDDPIEPRPLTRLRNVSA
jgi:hypothetical protein